VSGSERVEQRKGDTERPDLTRHWLPASAATVPFGIHTPAGILALQRQAGNQSTTAFVQAQSVGPAPTRRAAGPTSAPSVLTVQRGVLDFIGDVVDAAGSYAADLGRGAKRAAKGLRFWDPDALVKMHEENASAARLLGRLVSDPLGTIEAALTGVASGVITYAGLPDNLKAKARDKFKDAAPGIVQKIIAKVVGKALVQKSFVAIANRILTSAVVKKLLAKLGASAVASKTGVGIPLAVFSSLGLVEKAAGAADRLQARFPEVYRQLAADDLHMLWFVIEPHLPAIMLEVYAQYAKVAEYIDRTQPDGRVLIDAGGGDDRTPINAGPERRTPIRSGGG
jgi:hypothetical protein